MNALQPFARNSSGAMVDPLSGQGDDPVVQALIQQMLVMKIIPGSIGLLPFQDFSVQAADRTRWAATVAWQGVSGHVRREAVWGEPSPATALEQLIERRAEYARRKESTAARFMFYRALSFVLNAAGLTRSRGDAPPPVALLLPADSREGSVRIGPYRVGHAPKVRALPAPARR